MRTPALKPVHFSLLVQSLTFAMGGCDVLNVLPFQETKVRIVTTQQPEKKEPELVPPEPQALKAARLARRLTLDIAQRLPYDFEVEGLVANPLSRTVFIESLLGGPAAPQAIAALHARMWHLNNDDLPDLDEFAISQESFRTRLTDIRHDLLKEPILHLRKVLHDRLPLRFILSGRISITTEAARDFWGLSDAGQTWVDDIYRTVEFSDGRPDAGMLASNGWLSAFSGRRETPGKHRAFRTLSELTCRSFDGSEAHLFTSLSDADFEMGLNHVSLSNKACAGCHQTLSEAAPSYTGLGTGSSFETWRTYNLDSSPKNGSYYGSTYSDLAEFGKLIGQDPQFLRCERDKIVGAILQRPFGSLDQAPGALILDFAKENPDFLSALLPLFESNTYAYGAISPKVKGPYIRQASGLKFLRRHHFEAFARLWAPNLLEKGLDMALEPGLDEVVGDEDMIPSGPYWHALDKIASQLAHAIVTRELTTGMVADDRLLLKVLPSGTSYGSSDELIERQMIALWKHLTTEALAPTSETLNLFKIVWQSAGPITNVATYRTAWTMVLYAMFTHPNFLTY